MAYVLVEEIRWLAKVYGIKRLAFLTLTFRHHITKIREAQRRFNNLNRRVLKGRYSHAIGVVERQESGRLHFHLVVVLPVDIRTGFDFEAVSRRDYRSANQALRSEWAFWRETAPKYGFGRTELLPVKSSADGIARYVGKYVAKHIGMRESGDKGARIVRFIGFKPGERHFYSNFAWNNSNGWLWRHKLAAWCKGQDIETLEQLKEIFGRRWAYLLQDEIMATRVDEVHPDFATAQRSVNLHLAGADQAERVEDEKSVRAGPGARVYQLNEGDRFKRLQRLEIGGIEVFTTRKVWHNLRDGAFGVGNQPMSFPRQAVLPRVQASSLLQNDLRPISTLPEVSVETSFCYHARDDASEAS